MKVKRIHTTFSSRVKVVALVHKIQQAIAKACAESLLSHTENQHAFIQKNPGSSPHDHSLDKINSIFEMSQSMLETNVIPLLTQFQSLLESAQIASLPKTPETSSNLSAFEEFDSVTESLMILAECSTALTKESNNAARTIQQLTQARNTFM